MNAMPPHGPSRRGLMSVAASAAFMLGFWVPTREGGEAAAAGREIDPEHFGVSIGYRHEPLTDEQLAGLTTSVKNRDVDPASLVPVGPLQLRQTLEEMIAAGMSKFVLRPPAMSPAGIGPQTWLDELTALADAVTDLQT